jgi:methyltransferase (TIGR00027 family)
MHATEYSRTAEFMAVFRALETARSPKVRLFNDPWAIGFLRPSFRVLAELARLPFIGWLLTYFLDWRWPGARSSGVARTRYIDEALIGALGEGIGQVVLLGAGFDCRAYRLAQMAKVRVFEVDHPNTSAMKQKRVRGSLGQLPSYVSFVAIDFNREKLNDVLERSGLDLARPVFFLWEGVTQYLTADAVDATFRYVATAAPGSEILFTYVDEKVLRPQPGYVGISAIARAVNNAAEPWVFGFRPSELPDYLEHRGLKLVSDLGATEYRALYMDPKRRMRGYEFYRAAIAEIVGTSASLDSDHNKMKSTAHA